MSDEERLAGRSSGQGYKRDDRRRDSNVSNGSLYIYLYCLILYYL